MCLGWHESIGSSLMAVGVPRTDYEEFADTTSDSPECSERIGGSGHYGIGAVRTADDVQAKQVMDEPLLVVTNELLRS